MTPSAHDLLTTRLCAQPNCPLEAERNGYCREHQRRRPMPTLEELIDQQINLGHKDPHEIPALLERALGDDLFEVVKPYISDFIAEMGRHRLGQLRRQSVAKISAKTIADPEIMLQSMWVPEEEGPNITYKRIADMTAADFEARAAYLEHMARGIARSAEWCRDCAKAIKKAKVATAGELGTLPPLPETVE